MIKYITKIGNSQGLILDSTLMDMAHLKMGDEVNIEVHPNGAITLTPLRPRPDAKVVSKVINATMTDYERTMRRLA